MHAEPKTLPQKKIARNAIHRDVGIRPKIFCPLRPRNELSIDASHIGTKNLDNSSDRLVYPPFFIRFKAERGPFLCWENERVGDENNGPSFRIYQKFCGIISSLFSRRDFFGPIDQFRFLGTLCPPKSMLLWVRLDDDFIIGH